MAIPSNGHYIDVAVTKAAPVAPEPELSLLRPILMRGTGTLRDPATDAYVGRIARRLSAAWPVPGVVIPVYLIPDDNFTAEGTANGAVFLTTGVLQYMADHPEVDSEDFLAFILAHEMSHVLLGHARDRAHEHEMLHRASAVMSLASNIMARAKNAGIAKDSLRAGMAVLVAVEVADGSVFPGMGREQEQQADTLAIDLMAKAGYSVDAVPKVMAVLEAQEAVDAARRQASRVALLRPTPNGASLQFGPYLQQMWQDQGQEHPPAANRDAFARQYIHREWDDQSVALHQTEMTAFLHDRSVRQMLADTQTMLRAYALITQRQIGPAAQMFAQVRSPAVRNSPLGLSAALMLATPTGSGNRTDSLVDQSLAQSNATEPLFIFRADQLEASGHADQALRLQQAAYERFEDPNLFPYQIRLLRRLNRQVEATAAAAKCFATGETALQQLCTEASKT